jgi:hypothetical protein
MERDTDKNADLTPEQQACVQELENLAAKIVEDYEVSDAEIEFISDWLERHAEHRSKWPLSTLFNLLTQIKEDGRVDEDERLQLMSVLSGLAVFADKEPG